MTHQTCTMCLISKPIESFGLNRAFKGGRHCYCRDCHCAKSKRWRDENLIKALMSVARARAARKGIPFTIDKTDLHIPEVCPILGIPLDRALGRDHTPSIDRIDSSRGYEKGNVQILSSRANMLKSDATDEEMLALGRYAVRRLT